MKSILKPCSIFLLLCFSFYYANQISDTIIYHSNLMQDIISNKENYEQISVDAQIQGDYIIPGVNGLIVSELESYYKMKANKVFETNDLVFKQTSPNISLEDNRNLIIKQGNYYKKAVSIIVDKNKEIIDYSNQNNIVINNIDDLKDFVCIFEHGCLGKYNVEPTYNLNNNTIYNVSSGDIIFIEDNMSLKNYLVLLKNIKYQDLRIISLKALISEQR